MTTTPQLPPLPGMTPLGFREKSRENIGILFPKTWSKDAIDRCVLTCKAYGFSVVFDIGDTDSPCVDARNPSLVQAILREENQCKR